MNREEAEINAIGVLLNDDSRYIDSIENFYTRIQPRYFGSEAFRIIYDTMRGLHSKGKPTNIVEIAEAIKSLNIFDKDTDGLKKVLENARDNAAFMAESLETFSNAILDGYIKTSTISLLNEEKPADELVKALESITDEYRQSKNSINDSNANLLDYMKNGFAAELNNYVKTKEISTGFKELDGNLGSKAGLLPERLYILGAIPSLGKTTFIHQIADNIAAQGTPVLFFSLEQSRQELVCKSIVREHYKVYKDPKKRKCTETLATVGLLMKQGIKGEGLINAARAYAKTAANMNIYEGNFSTTVETIAATVKRFKRINRDKTPVVIIDYLQIIKPTDQNSKAAYKTKDVIDAIINNLKILARVEKVPVIAISSINRDHYAKQASFSGFKESGSIEYSADVVMALQLKALDNITDPKVTDGTALEKAKAADIRELKLVCLKNRGGKLFSMDLFYKPQHEYFTTDLKELKQ